MSLNADALAYLEEKGMSLADVIELARLMEKRGPDPTNAARQARHRAKHKSNGVTVTPVTPPNEYISNPPVPPVISDEMTSPAASDEPNEPEQPEKLKPEHVVEAWNELAERLGLAAVKKLPPTRNRQLASRIRQNTIEEFQTALAAIERSAFLRGENDRGWRADFDFLLQPKSFTKLLEGAYDH